MKPVTDPALLAQLDGPDAGGMTPVTDPAILQQLDAPAEPLSRMERFAYGALAPFKALDQMASRFLPTQGAEYAGMPMGDAAGMPALTPMAVTKEEYDRGIAEDEANYQARRKADGQDGIDWWRLAGSVATTAPLAALAPNPATIGGAVATGAVTGAVSGALEPVTDTSKPFWQQKGKQALVGGATGGVTAPLAYGASKILAPTPSKDVSALTAEGITLTPGQLAGPRAARLEEKLSSFPVVGGMVRAAQDRGVESFNVAAYNRALAPIGERFSGKVGREGVEEVGSKLSAAYEEVLPKLTFTADDQFVTDLKGVLAAASENLDPADAQRMAGLIQNKFIRRFENGQMDGRSYKQSWSELSRLAGNFSGDASADKRMLGEALTEALGTMREALTRTNPQYAERLAAIDEGWAIFTRLRSAAASLGNEAGTFTPAQLQNAVKAGDKSVGKGAFARGDALLQDLSEPAKGVMSPKVPNSGTVDRLMAGGGVGGAAAAAGYGLIDPLTAVALGLATVPYTRGGQKVLTGLLAGPRNDLLRQAGTATRAAGPLLGMGVTQGLLAGK